MAYGSSSFGSEAYGSSSNITPLGVITYFLSGHLSKANITITFTLDAKIVSRPQKTFTLDAIIVLRNTKTFTLDAPLQKKFTKIFTVDGLPLKTGITKSFAIDSRLIFRREKTFTLNTTLQKKFTKTFEISARTYFIKYWLDGWKRRKKVTINGTAKTLVNVPKKITIYKGIGTDSCGIVYINTVRDDFGDIRFTNQDGKRELDYIRTSFVSGISAVFYVKIPYVPITPDETFIYMYYDNLAVVTDGTYIVDNITEETIYFKTANAKNDGIPVYWKNGASIPAGTYRIDWSGWTVYGVSGDPWSAGTLYIMVNGTQSGVKLGSWVSYASAPNGYIIFAHPGGTLGIAMLDSRYWDNDADVTATTIFYIENIISCSWGLEETKSLIRTMSRTHRVGLRIING